MTVIRFEVSGDEATERHLLRFGERMSDARPAFAAVAEMMRIAERERFDAQGPGWAPLAESTVAQKSSEGLDPRILHATLALRQSLTEPGGENFAHITSQGLHFGSSNPYGGFHQKGTVSLPVRKVLDFDEGHVRAFTRELQRWMVHGDLMIDRALR